MNLPGEAYDVIVIGGGPAGSAAAALLARAGRRVALFEKDTFPRDKLCGEFLSHEAERLLRRVGCLDALHALEPAPIRRACFHSPHRTVWFGLPGCAYGISRARLDAALLDHAAASGADVFTGAEVLRVDAGSGPHDGWRSVEVRLGGSFAASGVACRAAAPVVIAAHGRRSRLDRRLGRSFLASKHPYLGFKRHHRPLNGRAAPGAGTVEMFTFRGGYCGLAPIEGGLVNVCMLLHQKLLSQVGTTQWESLLQALGRMNPALGHRLVELEPVDATVQAVAQVPMVFKERSAHGLLFIGDAAGMVAPLVGDGQGMALESAVLLADLVQRVPARPGRAELAWLARNWDRAWRRWFSWRLRLGRLFQAALLRPHAADLLLALLDGAAPLKNYLVRVTRGK